jgi:hypothetical protein
MSRIPVVRPSKDFTVAPRPIGGEQHVARLFVPRYDGGIAITILVRPGRNSDARRRLARMFDPRRVVS